MHQPAPVVVLREVAQRSELVLNLAGRYGRPFAMHQCVIFGSASGGSTAVDCTARFLVSVIGSDLDDYVLPTKSTLRAL